MPDRFQIEFAAALKSGDAAGLARYLTDPAALGRVAVYRNTVVRSAIEVLRAAYPAVNRIVGANFFSPMAKTYWEVSPPRDPVMAAYGAGFARFLAGYAPAEGLPYLAGVAHLDRSWQEAHQAAEHPVLTPAAIMALEPAALPGLAPGLHPSARLCTLDWTVYAIWTANREAAPVPRIEARRAREHVLVWRHRGGVSHQLLSAADHAFLAALERRETIEAAAAAAALIDAQHDAAALFGRLTGRSVFNGLSS